MEALRIGPEHTIPAAALWWTATTSGGPGGQHANRNATRVELRCDLQRARLPRDVIHRMRRLAPRFFDEEGLLITSERTRSQSRNVQDARERLRDLVRKCWRAPKKRRPTRPSRGARQRRLDAKKQHGEKKRRRSWRPDR
jgi:ribosome-associated protein